MDDSSSNPEQATTRAELRELLEEAMLDLPAPYRTVLMLRDIEERSTSETADALGLTEENVKVRLHRGHGMVRTWLLARVGANAKRAFPVMGGRGDRVVQAVFARLGGPGQP
jgi:RNA polymerase sigma-70 factor, ECF subfamily